MKPHFASLSPPGRCAAYLPGTPVPPAPPLSCGMLETLLDGCPPARLSLVVRTWIKVSAIGLCQADPQPSTPSCGGFGTSTHLVHQPAASGPTQRCTPCWGTSPQQKQAVVPKSPFCSVLSSMQVSSHTMYLPASNLGLSWPAWRSRLFHCLAHSPHTSWQFSQRDLDNGLCASQRRGMPPLSHDEKRRSSITFSDQHKQAKSAARARHPSRLSESSSPQQARLSLVRPPNQFYCPLCYGGQPERATPNAPSTSTLLRDAKVLHIGFSERRATEQLEMP